ncbi:hypothetical protein LG293_15825 (plasmid) [Citricoccus nitrophenolicus]
MEQSTQKDSPQEPTVTLDEEALEAAVDADLLMVSTAIDSQVGGEPRE